MEKFSRVMINLLIIPLKIWVAFMGVFFLDISKFYITIDFNFNNRWFPKKGN